MVLSGIIIIIINVLQISKLISIITFINSKSQTASFNSPFSYLDLDFPDQHHQPITISERESELDNFSNVQIYLVLIKRLELMTSY